MDSEEIKEVLVSLGYDLVDRGTYWQTTAVFRNGDNKTALQIYKDSGVWRDFVEQTPPLKFERLVEKSVGKNTHEFKEILQGNYRSVKDANAPVASKISMEEVYGEDCLKKLLPHYRFYSDRGISDDTLKGLRGGLATEGQMYQRFVFPIYNEFSQIIGFSGRDMLNKPNRPKWKHIGRKSKWLYPVYIPGSSPSFKSRIEEATEIILAESIGDLLSLHDHGYFNSLVTFGLDVGPALISLLVQLNPEKIILSFNNDSDKKENRGLNGAFKNYLKLLSYFDYQKLFICLPTCNDFGDMSRENFEKWEEKLDNLDPALHGAEVLKYSETLADTKQLSQKLIKNRNILAELCDA